MFHMKIRFFAILMAICAATTAFTACSGDNREPQREGVAPSVIETEPEKEHFIISEVPQSKPVRSTKSADGQTIYKSLEIEDLTIVQLAQADKAAAKNMRKVMSSAYDRHISAYESSLESLNSLLTAETIDMSVFPYETKVDYSCVRNDGKAISILEEITSYSAGNPISTTTFSYNFDPATGEQINQVFYESANKQSFDKADNQLYEKLLAQYGDIINYSYIPSSFIEAAEDCWYFTKDGVKIVFNPGDAAPEEAGVLDAEFSKEELPELAQKYFN